ncbi:hypothetical protein MKK75_18180 [Methylobacterium sp. J-030]|uniref:hypothetical protein n=1 Tax=Methylobacterium sp. J-030 TaxID=2836627 RepID=UPI001FB86BA7|nr:hypothetical protein [Methylobacterium sp. J-030]MCJ2070696.1 hypothetical protein [Methylobacterium sp. J-030]
MLHLWARRRFPACVSSGALIGLLLALSPARAEPPIRSPEDAACRLEAKAKVFAAPNPRGLELEEIGKQIYYACMARLGQSTQPARVAKRRHKRRRR